MERLVQQVRGRVQAGRGERVIGQSALECGVALLRGFLVLFEGFLIAGSIYGQSLLGRQLFRKLQRKTVSVIKLEGCAA